MIECLISDLIVERLISDHFLNFLTELVGRSFADGSPTVGGRALAKASGTH